MLPVAKKPRVGAVARKSTVQPGDGQVVFNRDSGVNGDHLVEPEQEDPPKTTVQPDGGHIDVNRDFGVNCDHLLELQPTMVLQSS